MKKTVLILKKVNKNQEHYLNARKKNIDKTLYKKNHISVMVLYDQNIELSRYEWVELLKSKGLESGIYSIRVCLGGVGGDVRSYKRRKYLLKGSGGMPEILKV